MEDSRDILEFDETGKVVTSCKNKNVTSIVIPNGVTKIRLMAFDECTSLKSITVDKNNDNYTDIDGVLFNKDCTAIIRYPVKKEGNSYKLPDSVTEVDVWSFEGCKSLVTIDIPDSVTEIENEAFKGCTSLVSINIPDSITEIGDWILDGCTSLKSITVDKNNDNYTDIDGVLFSKDCSTLIRYPEGKEDTSYKIPDGVTEIRQSAFENCTALKSINIPDSVTEIGTWGFDGCTSLQSITVDNNNAYFTDIDGVLFNKDCTNIIRYPEGKEGYSYKIPDSVTEIDSDAFKNCAFHVSTK